MLRLMVTPRKSQYAKAFDRATKAYVEWALTDAPSERLERRVQRELDRLAHWESHEADTTDCPWCRRHPPMSY